MSKLKRQKRRNQDFQKKKLKVGKSKPKASNVTDTSFVSRAISVKKQYLGGCDDNLLKKLSLLKHHNPIVRKETIQAFQKMISTIVHTKIMTPLLTQCIPMMCDESRQVRYALMDLFHEVGQYNDQVLKLFCRMLVLYVNMAMTHITSTIQIDSARFLSCLLKYCGEDICAQSFVGLLTRLFSLLGWSQATSQQVRRFDGRQLAVHMDTLCELIRCGCKESSQTPNICPGTLLRTSRVNPYLIPEYPQPYQHLKLFSRKLHTGDGPSTIYTQDVDARRRVLNEQDLQGIRRKLDIYIKEGGDVGKSADSLKRLLDELQ